MKGKNLCNVHIQSFAGQCFAVAPQKLPSSLLNLSLGQHAIACSLQFSYIVNENVWWLYSYSAASIRADLWTNYSFKLQLNLDLRGVLTNSLALMCFPVVSV